MYRLQVQGNNEQSEGTERDIVITNSYFSNLCALGQAISDPWWI
jgi:hypothetical protein